MLFLISLWLFSCNKSPSDLPLKTLASLAKVEHIGEYKFVVDFYVDYRGNVYIPDYTHYKVDKYNSDGKLVLSLGRRGEGPGEFPYVPAFAVDNKGYFYFFFRGGKVSIFDSKGSFLAQKRLPERYNRLFPKTAKISPLGDLAILFVDFRDGQVYYKIVLFKNLNFLKGKEIRTFSRKNLMFKHRFLAPFLTFSPSFDFDENGNLLISDTFDYKIFLFCRDKGHLEVFSRKCEHDRIRKEDLYLQGLPEENKRVQESLISARRSVSSLKGNEAYYPCIFKINADHGKIYVWTTKFRGGQFIVDVYNRKFNLIEKRKFYNALAQRDGFSWIRNGFLYMADILPEDERIRWGKLLYAKIPPPDVIKTPILK